MEPQTTTRPEPPITASLGDLAKFYLDQAREYAPGKAAQVAALEFALEDGWDAMQSLEISVSAEHLRQIEWQASERAFSARGRRLDGTYREGRRA